MYYFWDSEVWAFLCLLSSLFLATLLANVIKKKFTFLKNSLIPTSVLGGLILLLISTVFELITNKPFFNLEIFGGNGNAILEVITYHALALGFIATTLKTTEKKFTKERTKEIFNTGVTTVSSYLLQAVFGLGITLGLSYILTDVFPISGILLPFGYGQGTGQALNWGKTYETDWGFIGGSSFGLTIAALGFLSASFGGVIHLNILKKKGKIKIASDENQKLLSEDVQSDNEIPMNGSMDKMTVQLALVLLAYVMTYALMALLTKLIGMQSVIYGFNFLFGVLMASVIKLVAKFSHKKGIIKKYHRNNFLLDRISNTCFDVMVVAGIAAIRFDVLGNYWIVLIILGVVGALVTYFYNRYIARKFFAGYADEQFLMMYGMLTGTASTGMILLREADEGFKTPVADNLVYQNFPAMVFGFPLMLLANLAPKEPWLTFGILVAFLLVMNIILFRSYIFKRKNKQLNAQK